VDGDCDDGEVDDGELWSGAGDGCVDGCWLEGCWVCGSWATAKRAQPKTNEANKLNDRNCFFMRTSSLTWSTHFAKGHKHRRCG
jgi:hypothetical protein